MPLTAPTTGLADGSRLGKDSPRIEAMGAIDELNRQLREIMQDIHNRCVEHGSESDDYVNYLKGANIAGFIKVADAMLDHLIEGLVAATFGHSAVHSRRSPPGRASRPARGLKDCCSAIV